MEQQCFARQCSDDPLPFLSWKTHSAMFVSRTRRGPERKKKQNRQNKQKIYGLERLTACEAFDALLFQKKKKSATLANAF